MRVGPPRAYMGGIVKTTAFVELQTVSFRGTVPLPIPRSAAREVGRVPGGAAQDQQDQQDQSSAEVYYTKSETGTELARHSSENTL